MTGSFLSRREKSPVMSDPGRAGEKRNPVMSSLAQPGRKMIQSCPAWPSRGEKNPVMINLAGRPGGRAPNTAFHSSIFPAQQWSARKKSSHVAGQPQPARKKSSHDPARPGRGKKKTRRVDSCRCRRPTRLVFFSPATKPRRLDFLAGPRGPGQHNDEFTA